ncbi:MAG: TetR/AcrR family transcriptional regulator [Mycobacterium sp.]|nr:TetR/AcrR family transcriptional regulator [Mycobacterium sp.]
MATRSSYVIRALPGISGDSANGVLVASPRGRMLDAMTASVAENGYPATSVGDVIKRARASRSTFYEQFTDKEDCYLAAYRLASDHVAGCLAEAAQTTAANPSERLARIFDAYLTELARYPLAARAFLVEIRAAGAPSQQHHRAVVDQFAELLRIPGGDEDRLARLAVVALTDELVVREMTDHGVEQLPKLAPALNKLAARIVTPGAH